jgi:hypothetical protein
MGRVYTWYIPGIYPVYTRKKYLGIPDDLHAVYQYSASESSSNYPFAPLLQVGPAKTCSRFYFQAFSSVL